MLPQVPAILNPMTKGMGVHLTSPLIAGESQASCSTFLILNLLISKLARGWLWGEMKWYSRPLKNTSVKCTIHWHRMFQWIQMATLKVRKYLFFKNSRSSVPRILCFQTLTQMGERRGECIEVWNDRHKLELLQPPWACGHPKSSSTLRPPTVETPPNHKITSPTHPHPHHTQARHWKGQGIYFWLSLSPRLHNM